MDLEHVKATLLTMQPAAVFEPDAYLSPWFNPAVCAFFLKHAVEVVPVSQPALPKGIQWGVGEPFQCHRNSLSYAAEHPGSSPFFGFQYLQWASLYGEAPSSSFELHSWVVVADGSIVDSGQYVPQATRYVGIPWSWALHDLLARKEIA